MNNHPIHQPIAVHTLVLYPRPHVDTIVAILLLREFGEELFPGIVRAPIAFWTEPRNGQTAEELLTHGFLLVDMGGGPFDHHKDNKHAHDTHHADCAATLVAKYLGIDKRPYLQKLLRWAQRDDIEGKGTSSNDPLDRAFGLSGLIMSLHRMFLDDPKKVVDAVLPVLRAHLWQEKRRYIDLPQEWATNLANNTARLDVVSTSHGDVRIAVIASPSRDMAGFLRANPKIAADMVIQQLPTQHINIITKQDRALPLARIAAALRFAEAAKQHVDITHLSGQELKQPGRIADIPQWFYDDVAKTIQNGGIIPSSAPATMLSLDDVFKITSSELSGA